MRKLVLALLAAGSMLLGADVAGTWKGNSFRADGTPLMDLLLTLKTDSGKLSGTVGPSEYEQVPISNAKLDEEKLTFDVVTNDATYRVSMTASGDELKGTAVPDGQESRPMKVELKRTKAAGTTD